MINVVWVGTMYKFGKKNHNQNATYLCQNIIDRPDFEQGVKSSLPLTNSLVIVVHMDEGENIHQSIPWHFLRALVKEVV